MSYEYPQDFLELNSTDIDNLVNVNITSLNAMTRLVLPQMVERKNGAIINLSSFCATIPTPLPSVYSASKSVVSTYICFYCFLHRGKSLLESWSTNFLPG